MPRLLRSVIGSAGRQPAAPNACWMSASLPTSATFSGSPGTPFGARLNFGVSAIGGSCS